MPADLQGFYSLSIARDFRFSVSTGPKFALGPFTFSTTPAAPTTLVPQTVTWTLSIATDEPSNSNIIAEREPSTAQS